MVSAAANTKQLDMAEKAASDQNKRKEPKNHHDALHNFDVYECCWCMCVRCWLKYSGGLGRCICSHCPCHRGQFIPTMTLAQLSKRGK